MPMEKILKRGGTRTETQPVGIVLAPVDSEEQSTHSHIVGDQREARMKIGGCLIVNVQRS